MSGITQCGAIVNACPNRGGSDIVGHGEGRVNERRSVRPPISITPSLKVTSLSEALHPRIGPQRRTHFQPV